jgi:hypothetical protein
MALNHTVARTEDPRLPGFTALGERAASHSMLTGGGAWSAGVTFRQAPIHLMQMLNPRLSASGADEYGGYVCLWTMPEPGEVSVPAEDVVLTFPGRGAQDVPTQETAREEPFVPGDFAGLPQGTTTGPISTCSRTARERPASSRPRTGARWSARSLWRTPPCAARAVRCRCG